MKLLRISAVTMALSVAVVSYSGTANEVANITKAELKLAQTKDELREKLNKINFFSAKFDQKVFDEQGNELNQGSGNLSVNKPNLVNWETQTPDESLIISDGSNLWFYDPFVEQVSIYALENAIANTPILLITNDDEALWQQYDVVKVNDISYQIRAKDLNARVKSLELNFSPTSTVPQLSGFNLLDATGQLSVIKFNSINIEKVPEASLFTFTLPEGVYVDDQR